VGGGGEHQGGGTVVDLAALPAVTVPSFWKAGAGCDLRQVHLERLLVAIDHRRPLLATIETGTISSAKSPFSAASRAGGSSRPSRRPVPHG